MPERVEDRPRHTYIGSSEAAALLGLDPYTSRMDLWNRKTGRFKDEDNDLLDLGLHLEPWVRKKIPEKREEVLEVVDPEPGMILHENGILGGHDDGDWYPAELDAPGPLTLEIKTVNDNIWRIIQEQGLNAGNVLQLNTMAGLKERPGGGFDIFNRGTGRDHLFFRLAFHPDLYERVAEEADRFWHEHVLPDIPPPEFPEKPVPPIPRLTGDTVILTGDPEWEELMEEYTEYKELSDKINAIWEGAGIPDEFDGEPTDEMLGLEARIKARIEEEGVENVMGHGWKWIWRPGATQNRLNGKLITEIGPLDPAKTFDLLNERLADLRKAGGKPTEEWLATVWGDVEQECRMIEDDFKQERRWPYFRPFPKDDV